MSNEASKSWMIYGAYGYTGELVVQEAIAQKRRPVLAGRNEAKTKAVAEKYGSVAFIDSHKLTVFTGRNYPARANT